jgi:uncharacterized coiled-coil protein SlyX
MQNSIVKFYKGAMIRIDLTNYVCLNDAATANGKDFRYWLKLKVTVKYLKILEATTSDVQKMLVLTLDDGITTWAHPEVALRFAQWCEPEFAIQLNRWIEDLKNKPSALNSEEVKSPQLFASSQQLFEAGRVALEKEQLDAINSNLAEQSLQICQIEAKVDEMAAMLASILASINSLASVKTPEQASPPKLVSVAEFEKMSGLSPSQIRSRIQQSIDHPDHSPLRNGIHYVWSEPGKRGGRIRINPELFRSAIGLS